MDLLEAEQAGDTDATTALSMVIGSIAADHPAGLAIIGLALVQVVAQGLGEAGLLVPEARLPWVPPGDGEGHGA